MLSIPGFIVKGQAVRPWRSTSLHRHQKVEVRPQVNARIIQILSKRLSQRENRNHVNEGGIMIVGSFCRTVL